LPKTQVMPKGVIQRSEGSGPPPGPQPGPGPKPGPGPRHGLPPNFAALAHTPLLSSPGQQELGRLPQPWKAEKKVVTQHRLNSLRITLPEDCADMPPIYGRYKKDIVHPLYDVHMKSFERAKLEIGLAPYVDAAYRNMVALVQRYNKVGDAPRPADVIAEELSGSDKHWRMGNCVAVVMSSGGPKIALNELSKKKKEPRESLHPSGREAFDKYEGEFIDMDLLDYEHCEIRLWEQYEPLVDYIGIMQPCCLFCAAQLLSAGFTGFRGCHLKTYGRYTFSTKILMVPERLRVLLGGEVFDWYSRLNSKSKLDFLDLLAVAKGAQHKLSKVHSGKRRKTKE